ncbi:MAG: hypothetical protein RIF33_06515 [Cyclobacteriaceae bacterium]
MKLIYVDTSVFGGNYDDEFRLWSGLFFNRVFDTEIKLIYSSVAEDELMNAPEKVKTFVKTIPSKNILKSELTEEAIVLAEDYLSERVVGESSRADCYHIAMATVLKADVLVSWNFKHIVNVQRINGYNAVNLKRGYRTIEIRNPREIFDYEDTDEKGF